LADVLLGAFAFLIADIFIAFTPFKGVLFGLGILEIIAMAALILRATWDALPKSVQNALN